MKVKLLITLMLCLNSLFAYAEDVKPAFKSTNLPLPRFASLKSGEIYARVGPGKQYPIRYEYTQKNLPVEITLEYGPWRQIRDHKGDKGWIHSALLSGKRYGITINTSHTELKKSPHKNKKSLALIPQGSLVRINECENTWCKIEIKGIKGWVTQNNLFGVYQNENF